MDSAALMRRALEGARQRRDQAGVLVGDDQLDPGQATLLESAEEPAPEHLVFTVADVDAQHLAAAVGGHPGGDDDGHASDLPDPADVQIYIDGALVMEADVGPVAIRARLSASDGALLIAPDGLLGGFASVRVFDDPRVRVVSVGAQPQADGFTVVARAELR